MILDEFKVELIKAQKRIIRIGFGFLITFGVMTALIIIFAGDFDRKVIISLCISVPLAAIGFWMFMSSIIKNKKIRSGEFELIKAIENKREYPNYVVWIYQSTMITKHEMAGIATKSYHLVACKHNGKRIQFMLKTELQVQRMIEFLSASFPNALIGYNEENRKLAGNRIGKEIRR